MPNLANAKKALRKAKKATERNLKVSADLKTLLKKTRKAIDAKEATVAEKLRIVQKNIDKAVKKGVIKKNSGVRKLRRIHAHYKKTIQK